MKINRLEIDGFGVWSGLRLDDLDGQITVLHGPNEAGKTTLMQFVRTLLYGFSPERRRRYLPPVHTGRGGGAAWVTAPAGPLKISRYVDAAQGDLGRESLEVTSADGSLVDPAHLNELLSGIDEPTYQGVFALGIRDLQELSALSDIEAADRLYNLTSGVDRASLVEALRELKGSRRRLLCGGQSSSEISELIAERDRLERTIEQLGSRTHRYTELLRERQTLDREIAALEERAAVLKQDAAAAEIACGLVQPWLDRKRLDDEITTLGHLSLGQHQGIPDDAVARLEAYETQRGRSRRRAKKLKSRYLAVRRKARPLKVDERFARNIPRIEAMLEQEEWIRAHDQHVDSLRDQVAKIKSRLAAERQSLGLSDAHAAAIEGLSPSRLGPLRSAARQLAELRERRDKLRAALESSQAAASSQISEVQSALAARGISDLDAALAAAGSRVTQLRRRIQIDERLEQLARQRDDWDEREQDLLETQVLPMWQLVTLGGVFVFCMVMLLAGLFLPASITGSAGWGMAILGLLGAGAAVGTKFALEYSATSRLEAAQRQQHALAAEIAKVEEERDLLDEQLPRGGGPLAVRLEDAQQELAALEALLPLEGRRRTAQHQATADQEQLKRCEAQYEAARKNWRRAAEDAGLPEGCSPTNLKKLARHRKRLRQLSGELDHRQQELIAAQRTSETYAQRVGQLLSASGIEPEHASAAGGLAQLRTELGAKRSLFERRLTLDGRASLLRRKAMRHFRRARRARRRLEALCRALGVRDGDELRGRLVRYSHLLTLRSQREELHRQIVLALGGQCSEETVGDLIEQQSAEQLEKLWEARTTELEECRRRLAERRLHRDELERQVRSLVDDRGLAARRLDLAVVQARLRAAVKRWQVLATTERLFDQVRSTYERERQPRTLREASVYFHRLTDGRYTRVWTPLDERTLYVDDRSGSPVRVEVLSRGTREQLFLCLRLALVSDYASRGASLPLVLDDLLVNFDATRSKAAATLLRDVAAEGHQMLVFTCHEHIVKIFRNLKVPIRELPDSESREPLVTAVVSPPEIIRVTRPVEEERPAPRRKMVVTPEKQPAVEPAAVTPMPAFTPAVWRVPNGWSVSDPNWAAGRPRLTDEVAESVAETLGGISEPVTEPTTESFDEWPDVSVPEPIVATPRSPRRRTLIWDRIWDSAEEFDGEFNERVIWTDSADNEGDAEAA